MKETEDASKQLTLDFSMFIIKFIFGIPVTGLLSLFLMIGWNSSVRYLFPRLVDLYYLANHISYGTAFGFMGILYSVLMIMSYIKSYKTGGKNEQNRG